MSPTSTKLPDDDTQEKAKKPGGLSAGDLPVSPLSKEKSKQTGGPKASEKAGLDPLDKLPKGAQGIGGTGIEKGDTGGQKANKAASKAIDKAAGGGKAGGGTGKALKAVDKIDKESPEKKAEREGKLSNTALKGTGAAVGAAFGGTAGAQVGAKAGEEVSKHKGLALAILLLPLVILSIPFFFLIYIIQNPFDVVKEVLTNSKIREFGIDVAQAFADGALETAINALSYTGEVEYKGPNTAVAATATTIEPGTTLDKLSQINWKKAQYQNITTNCGYELKLKEVVNAEGRRRFVPDEVINTRSNTVIKLDKLKDSPAASYCIQKQYPIFNMMARQPITREVNTHENTDIHLDYAGKKDTSEFSRSKDKVDEYVFNKTLSRITPKKDDSIDFSAYQGQIDTLQNSYKDAVRIYNTSNPDDRIPYNEDKADIVEGINKMYDEMAGGRSPYNIQVDKYINVPQRDSITPNTPPDEAAVVKTGVATTICPFIFGFLDLGNNPAREESARNARKAIESRLASTERGAVKVLTLADTRKANQLSNVENNSTIAQQDNWSSSTAYQLDVYNELRGVQQNPEATSTRSYNARQIDLIDDPSIDVLLNACTFLTEENKTLLTIGDTLLLVGYPILKQQIVNQSQGMFRSIKDFGLKEIITSYIRTGSVTAVSGLEDGPENYNRQAAGFRQLMNDYYLRIGGRFLTETEARQLAIESEDIRRGEEKNNGIGYRLFAKENIRSARSLITQNTITPKTAMTASGAMLKELVNPLKSLASIHSSALYYGFGQHNKAFAANINGDQYLKIDTAGVPNQDFRSFGMLENATFIENIKANGTEDEKRKLAHYDECFKRKIPTSQYFKMKSKIFGDTNSDEVINDPELKASTLAKYPGANAIQWFVFYPEYHRGVIKDANGNIREVPTNDPDGLVNKFYDCKILLEQARDFNTPEHQLAIRYRMYNYYNNILDQMVSLSKDDDNQTIYANSGSGAAQPVSGDTQELAQQILDNPNIIYDPGTKEEFERLARGELATTTCSNAGSPTTTVDPKLLQAVLAMVEDGITPLRISALTDACHTDGSDHYTGHAIDIGNADEGSPEIGDRVEAFLEANRARFNIDQVIWREPDHYDHLHFSTQG